MDNVDYPSFLDMVADDFVRWIPGYKGRSVNHRGRRPDKDALWPLPLLQALLDEWTIAVYQNRPHSGLRVGAAPRMKLSPNAIYQALCQSAPTDIRTLSRDEWIGLHPHKFRRINRYGINLFNLVYDNDSPECHRLRRQKSLNKKQNGKWEIRYDPNNLMQIWVRDESVDYDEHGRQIYNDNGWIECRWVLAKFAVIPFGIDLLHAIRHDVGKKASDKQVLERAEHIHSQLLGGPPDSQRRPLTRSETVAGRANLARQQLCTPVPSQPDRDPSAQVVDAVPLPDEITPPPVEPMRAIRLSEGW